MKDKKERKIRIGNMTSRKNKIAYKIDDRNKKLK